MSSGKVNSRLAGSLLSMVLNEYYKRIIKGILDTRNIDEYKNVYRDNKMWFIDAVTKHGRDGECINVASALRDSLMLARDRVESVGLSLRGAGYSVLFVGFRLLGRGLVGVGSGVFRTVFEVGLSVDPLLGLPYYPASTLKGASRAMCEALVEADSNQGRSGPGGSGGRVSVCDVLFGTKSRAGLIVYTDAYPVGCYKSKGCMVYVGDVVTPHYYSGGNPVESELEAVPNPVVHLSIGENLVFETVIAAREKEWPYGQDEMLIPEVLGKYYGMGPLFMANLIMLAALLSGFAARSGKGYNIGESVLDPTLEEYKSIADTKDKTNLEDLRKLHENIIDSVDDHIVSLLIDHGRGGSRSQGNRQDRDRRRQRGNNAGGGGRLGS